MMDSQDLQSFIQRIQLHQAEFQDAIHQLTQAVIELNEENNRLRMMNHDLEERIQQQFAEEEISPSTKDEMTQNTSGRERLQGFYNDGIHICHELFGKRRESNEDCLFCQDVLMRLEQGQSNG